MTTFAPAPRLAVIAVTLQRKRSVPFLGDPILGVHRTAAHPAIHRDFDPGIRRSLRLAHSLHDLKRGRPAAVRKFERHAADKQSLNAIDVQIALNFLKVEASELAVAIVMSAMRACGLSGYRNDSEFTMGRYMRDILSSPIMINNDRILADSQGAVLMSDVPAGLSD